MPKRSVRQMLEWIGSRTTGMLGVNRLRSKIKTAVFKPSVDNRIAYFGSMLFQCALTVVGKRLAGSKRTNMENGRRAVFICDLGVSSCAFDFTVYIASAELHFRERGIDCFETLIVDDGVGSNAGDRFTRRQRILQLLMPLADSYQACSRVDLTSDMEYVRLLCNSGVEVYPQNYDGVFRRRSEAELFSRRRDSRDISGFYAKPHNRRLINEWIAESGFGDRPLVSITIRNSLFDVHRNTDIEMMVKFSTYLKELEIETAYVPDTETGRQGMEANGKYCVQASNNIYQRIALYEACALNIFSHNGPAEICLMNEETDFLIYGCFGEIRKGFDPKQKGDFARHRGSICYTSESVDHLISEFWTLVERNQRVRTRLRLEGKERRKSQKQDL